ATNRATVPTRDRASAAVARPRAALRKTVRTRPSAAMASAWPSAGATTTASTPSARPRVRSASSERSTVGKAQLLLPADVEPGDEAGEQPEGARRRGVHEGPVLV